MATHSNILIFALGWVFVFFVSARLYGFAALRIFKGKKPEPIYLESDYDYHLRWYKLIALPAKHSYTALFTLFSAIWYKLFFTPSAFYSQTIGFYDHSWVDKFFFSNITFLVFLGLSAFIARASFIPIYSGWVERELKKTSGKKEEGNISKKTQVDGIGSLGKAFKYDVGASDRPLVTFWDNQNNIDPWNDQRKTLLCSNSDRGLVIGMPGSGKTTFLIAQLISWMKSGQPFVCTDIKPEIWGILKKNGLFEKFGYRDIVFNPVNPASAHYNPLSEISDVIELSDLIETLIPPMPDSDNEVFGDSARKLLKCILLHLQIDSTPTLNDARKYIQSFGSMDDMFSELKKSKNEVVSIIAKEIAATATSGNFFGSVLAAMQKAFYFLDDSKIVDVLSRSDFKLSEIFKQERVALFLQFPETSQKLTKSIFSLMLSQCIDEVQRSAKSRSHAVFMAFDEITNSSAIPDFKNKMLLLRSSNAPTFLYFQEVAKLEDIYGSNAIDTFMGSATLKILYRVGDNKTAKYFSEALGKTEATFSNYATTEGSSSSSSADRSSSGSSMSRSSSQNTQLVDVIGINELLQLGEGMALINYQGFSGILPMPSYWKDYPLASQPIDGMQGDKTTP